MCSQIAGLWVTRARTGGGTGGMNRGQTEPTVSTTVGSAAYMSRWVRVVSVMPREGRPDPRLH